jgi:hypothetical protein
MSWYLLLVILALVAGVLLAKRLSAMKGVRHRGMPPRPKSAKARGKHHSK